MGECLAFLIPPDRGIWGYDGHREWRRRRTSVPELRIVPFPRKQSFEELAKRDPRELYRLERQARSAPELEDGQVHPVTRPEVISKTIERYGKENLIWFYRKGRKWLHREPPQEAAIEATIKHGLCVALPSRPGTRNRRGRRQAWTPDAALESPEEE